MLILRARHSRKGDLKRLDVVGAHDANASYHDAAANLPIGDYKVLHGGSELVELTVDRTPVVLQHVTVDGETTTTEHAA